MLRLNEYVSNPLAFLEKSLSDCSINDGNNDCVEYLLSTSNVPGTKSFHVLIKLILTTTCGVGTIVIPLDR